jgi:hypothetical protein
MGRTTSPPPARFTPAASRSARRSPKPTAGYRCDMPRASPAISIRPSSSGYMAGRAGAASASSRWSSRPATTTPTSRPSTINVLPNQWTQVIVPFSAVGNPSAITQHQHPRHHRWATTDLLRGQPLPIVQRRPRRHRRPAASVPIYLEALAPNWQNGSWDGSYNFAETAPSPVYAAASQSARRSPNRMARCQ